MRTLEMSLQQIEKHSRIMKNMWYIQPCTQNTLMEWKHTPLLASILSLRLVHMSGLF